MSNFQVIKLWWISCLHPCKDSPPTGSSMKWLAQLAQLQCRTGFHVAVYYPSTKPQIHFSHISQIQSKTIQDRLEAWGLLHLGTISQWFFSRFTWSSSEALYPFDERPPPVCLRQTSPADSDAYGHAAPRRRSLGHGPNLLDSDDEQMKVGGTWQRSLADRGFLGVSPQNSRWWWFEVEPTCFLFGFFRIFFFLVPRFGDEATMWWVGIFHISRRPGLIARGPLIKYDRNASKSPTEAQLSQFLGGLWFRY